MVDVPISNPDGGISKLNVMRDITELKRAEEILRRDKETFENLAKEKADELLAAHRELERAKRLSDIGRLAAVIAHELRNPLGVIKAAGYNLRRKSRDRSLETHIASIEKKVADSEKIIADLLSYAKIRKPAFGRVRIHDALAAAIAQAQKTRPAGIGLTKRIERLRGVIVEADVLHMVEIFGNIIDNAFSAVSGTRNGRVSVTGAAGADSVTVTVANNGPAIDAKDQPKIFEPFFTTKTKGVGLGLTICKELVDLHNGSIEVSSTEGKGTAVTVRIPLAQAR